MSRPVCPCGCGEKPAKGSIYAAYACRARARQRQATVRIPPQRQPNVVASPERPITLVVRTKELGRPAAAVFRPLAPGTRAVRKERAALARVCRPVEGLCRCGCGRAVRPESGVYAEPTCKKRVARRQHLANLRARRVGSAGIR